MKNFFLILVFTIFTYAVHANIVEELTNLNNLYKEGAITKEEFSKAKSIILKSNNREIKTENKTIIKKKKKKKN